MRDWQLRTPVDAIVFDCDGTLSSIEGIDELARDNGKADVVKKLTAEAMGKSGINPKIYAERLALVMPTRKQVLALGEKYFEHRVADVSAVVSLLSHLKKHIYILSAGLYPAVTIFANHLDIAREHVFAVDVQFDREGNFLDFDHQSPLVHSDGKRMLISQIKREHARIVHIGDGLNDYAAHDMVTRFVGYGGAFHHERVAEVSQYYITTPSLASLLPLCLTAKEMAPLADREKILCAKGLAAIQEGSVLLK